MDRRRRRMRKRNEGMGDVMSEGDFKGVGMVLWL